LMTWCSTWSYIWGTAYNCCTRWASLWYDSFYCFRNYAFFRIFL